MLQTYNSYSRNALRLAKNSRIVLRQSWQKQGG